MILEYNLGNGIRNAIGISIATGMDYDTMSGIIFAKEARLESDI